MNVVVAAVAAAIAASFRASSRSRRSLDGLLAGSPAGRRARARVREYGDTTEREIFVKSDLKYVKINFDDIQYVEAMADYVIIYVSGGRHIVHSTMKGMNEKLSQDNFVRVHRSYIANTNKILSVDNSTITLGEKQIPIGASYKANFMSSLKML